MPREHSAEEIEDYAMRMAWAGIPEDGKVGLRVMAKSALLVHEQMVERMRFNAIVNPTEGT